MLANIPIHLAYGTSMMASIISLLFATGKDSLRLGPPLESVKREHVPWPCLLQESFVSRTEPGMGSRWLLIEKHMLI